jgi:hypothetical protein
MRSIQYAAASPIDTGISEYWIVRLRTMTAESRALSASTAVLKGTLLCLTA